MDFTVSAGELIGGGIFLIILNIIIWVFAWGRTVGKVLEKLENHEERIDKLEQSKDHQAPLESCVELFRKISADLGSLKGQVALIIRRMNGGG